MYLLSIHSEAPIDAISNTAVD